MIQRAQEIYDQLVAWRREFHMYPELGFQESRTADRVVKALTEWGYRVRTGVGRTGVVAERGEGRPIVAIRADMDALPIQEDNDVPYASRIPGVMHACGHDAHTAILLGVARLLAEETFPGTVRLLFQPSEEAEDEEGVSGAPRMIQDGAMEGVEAVLALHVAPLIPTGKIGLEVGPASAGVDTFYVTLIGKGGHGAAPHQTVDPIYILGHVILGLHGIVSRRLEPMVPAVISIGAVHGGQADNVIPDRVELKGTIRYTKPEVQRQIHTEIERVLQMARALGGDYELRITTGYPPMVNDAGIVEVLRRVVVDLLGEEGLHPPHLGMGAEDFGFFSALAPGAMFDLGCRIEGDERVAHSPRFDIDERCLPIGTAVLAESALRLLRGER
ncbi:MAG: M20 metallopeptidase family protein [Anaerolineae bacterium]